MLDDDDRVAQIDQAIEDEVQDAVRFAEESPFPAPETALDYTYA